MSKTILIAALFIAFSNTAHGRQPPPPRAPAAEPAARHPFLMAIEDVFSIAGRGTVVTGRIDSGVVRAGDEIEIVGLGETRTSRVIGVEMFRRQLNSARAGDNVGILLKGIARNQVQRGQVLARPGSIRACATFDATIAIRRASIRGWRPQFYFRTTDVTGTISGSGSRARVALIAPIAMNPGQHFAIREGGRTVGTGTVLRCA